MSKDDAINIMNDGCFIKIFLLYIKMSESAYLTYYQRNRDVILNRARDFYENDKGRLRKQTRDKYKNLYEKGKNKKKRIWEK